MAAETARTDVDATNAQLRAMQALTDTALSHLALDDLLTELLSRVTDVMHVDEIGLFLLDEDGQTLTMRAARGVVVEHVCGGQVKVGHCVPGRIAASRAPLIMDEPCAADFEGASTILLERMHSIAGVPLLVEDQVGDHLVSRLVGVLVVGSTAPRHFTEADVQLLQRAADRIALAVDRARLFAAEEDARRQAETALARAQASERQAAERAERLNTILETIADGVAVYDAAGVPIQMVNPAYRKLFAVDRGPVGYESTTTFERARLVRVRDIASGAMVPFDETPVGRALRGEVVTGPSADIRARAFDGRELELNSSAAPLRAPDGQIAGAVLVLRDVSERNRLAREREEARIQAEGQAEQLDRIFESAADGLIVYDLDGRITRENSAARGILGLDAAPPGFRQLPERERFALYAPRDEQGRTVPPEESSFIRALHVHMGDGDGDEEGDGAKPEAREVHMRTPDGREIDLNVASAPLHDREGHVVGAVSVLRDLTERNRLAREREVARADELAAREASRRMEEFVAVAAHDLRAPLTAILGYLDLAERRTERLAYLIPNENPKLTHHVAAALSSIDDAGQGAERLARLLTLLFDTAAIRAGKLELQRAPLDLAALIREQVETLRMAAPERTIRLRAPTGGEAIYVHADADRIRQVLANYVTNALKYSPLDQPVTVSVEAHGEGSACRARVLVCDRGHGIPKEERAQVWDLFHRAHGATVTPHSEAPGQMLKGSLGLGLHICKAIITAHGGRVGVKSTIGGGSTFWFTLPLSATA